jgi:hypothetical protein
MSSKREQLVELVREMADDPPSTSRKLIRPQVGCERAAIDRCNARVRRLTASLVVIVLCIPAQLRAETGSLELIVLCFSKKQGAQEAILGARKG